jgi:hypothetical protein
MKKIIFSILFSFCFLFASTQNHTEDYYNPTEKLFTKPSEEVTTTFNKSKPQIGVMTGTSIGTFGKGNSFSSTFMAPYLRYSISSKLNLNAAAIFGNTNLTAVPDASQNWPNNFNQKALMVGMEYKITEHLRIGGSIQMNQGVGDANFRSPFFGNPMSSGFSPFLGW